MLAATIAGLLLYCPIIHAQQQDSNTGTSHHIDNAAPADVVALRAQVELMKTFQEQILATVYWALGVLATVAVLLVGFGWYANFRLYERDKETLRQDLASVSRESVATIQANLQALLKQGAEEVEGKLLKAAAAAAESVHSQLSMQITALRRDLKVVQLDVLESSAETWLARGVPTNAIRDYCGILQVGLDIGYDWHISRALDGIHKTLKMLRDPNNGFPPDAQQAGEITSLLERVPSSHSVPVKVIRDVLSEVISR